MSGEKSQTKHRAALRLESLEERNLLSAAIITPNGSRIALKDLQHVVNVRANNVPLSDRRMSYITPQGTQVKLTLYGFGSLAGTTVDSNGTLNIVYSKTTATTKIVGHTIGGTGYAPIGSIRNVNTIPGSASSSGVSAVGVVNLKHFNLVSGGYINLEGGVNTLALASAGANSAIYMTGVSVPTPSSSSSSSSNTGTITGTSTSGLGTTTSTTTGSTTTSNATGLTSGTGSGVPTIGSGNVSTTSAAATGTSAATLANATTATGKPIPPGAEVSILSVTGAPRSQAISDPQIFGYDPVAGALIRFDANNGNALQSIPLPFSGPAIVGVGLGRNNANMVALVGSGSTIDAYDVVTGAFVGSFSTTSLTPLGLPTITAIGSNNEQTYVGDSQAGPTGLIVQINVTESLATGSAVAVGSTITPSRGFELGGGLASVAGSDVIYAIGGAHFDQFQPDLIQEGVLALTPSVTGTVTETARTAITSTTTGSFINLGPPGSARIAPIGAFGSVDTFLALDTGVVNGQNKLSLLTPSTLTSVSTIGLNDPNLLGGLSGTFHPELLNGVVLDVTNNLRRFVGKDATGLVINTSLAINLVQIKTATATAVIGRPVNHVNIPRRKNVIINSNARGPFGKGTRNGVVIDSALPSTGPIYLP